jgi:hypothetical protein
VSPTRSPRPRRATLQAGEWDRVDDRGTKREKRSPRPRVTSLQRRGSRRAEAGGARFDASTGCCEQGTPMADRDELGPRRLEVASGSWTLLEATTMCETRTRRLGTSSKTGDRRAADSLPSRWVGVEPVRHLLSERLRTSRGRRFLRSARSSLRAFRPCARVGHRDSSSAEDPVRAHRLPRRFNEVQTASLRARACVGIPGHWLRTEDRITVGRERDGLARA